MTKQKKEFLNWLSVQTMTKQEKEFLKLFTDDKNIYFYQTKVATIDHLKRQVIVKNWSSRATSKHINYVANLLNYQTIKLY